MTSIVLLYLTFSTIILSATTNTKNKSLNANIDLAPVQNRWQRCALVYLTFGKTPQQLRNYIQRRDESGQYIDQRMFDSIILIPDTADRVPPSQFNENGMRSIVQKMIDVATVLDDVIHNSTLSGKNSIKIQVMLGLPYFPPDDVTVELDKTNYKLSVPDQRDQVALWFVRQIKNFAKNAKWQYLNLYGTYFLQEGINEMMDDLRYVPAVNKVTQRDYQLGTVWIPGYEDVQGHSWRGQELGFNVTVVQPSYAFLSTIDGCDVRTPRLYSAGYKSLKLQQNFEYELRYPGQSVTEYQISHQYLAISQTTGASKFPQAFFLSYFLDGIESQEKAPGSSWQIYQDLANYLKGDVIPNFELDIPWQPKQVNKDVLELKWKVPANFDNINSIRLDFKDVDALKFEKFWRGRLTVQTMDKFDSRRNIRSYTQRLGSELLDPSYESVAVPMANLNSAAGTELKIQLNREQSNISWPIVWRLVATKFEVPTIANPISEQISSSSTPISGGHYKDQVASHLGFESGGKLNDGKISSLTSTTSWAWSGVMGWATGHLLVTTVFDLGQVTKVAGVRFVTHEDVSSAVFIPAKLSALTSTTCEPQTKGVEGLSCVPSASTSTAKLTRGIGGSRNLTLYYGHDQNKRSGQIEVPARFVTVTWRPSGWCMVDEIEIFDGQGKIVNLRVPYRITPITGPSWDNKEVAYGDNNGRLLDGNILNEWIYGLHGSTMFDGLQEKDDGGTKVGGSVQAIWREAKLNVRNVVIWFTRSQEKSSVFSPDYVFIQWRNSTLHWQVVTKVMVNQKEDYVKSCGVTSGVPCVKLAVGGKGGITGVKATFPQKSYFMVSEISIE